jgi:hypothetical protein
MTSDSLSWTSWGNADARLEMLARNEIPILEIAVILQRTKAACEKRLYAKGIPYVKNGMPKTFTRNTQTEKAPVIMPLHKNGETVNYAN